MKKLLYIPIFAAATLALGACASHPISIPNIFGGPPLVLTGSLQNDLPSINAFNATLKAGAAADLATIQSNFALLCPYVATAASDLPAAATAAQQLGVSSTAVAKQVSNANVAVNAATVVCSGGTATNLAALFSAAVDAVNLVKGLLHK